MLKETIQDSICFRVSIQSCVKVLPDNANRGVFLVTGVHGGLSGVSSLIDSVDKVLLKFGQPTYFKRRDIHVSVARCATGYESFGKGAKSYSCAGNPSRFFFEICQISCRIGQHTHTMRLV